jgi:dipeptidyl aminopeptidase/acylaminoacyl peptidase
MLSALVTYALAGAQLPLVYFSSTRTPTGDHELWVMGIDGSNQTRLTNRPLEDTSPAPHPSGYWIAFHSHVVNNNGNVHRIAVGGGMEENLTAESQLHDTRPAYSPDGAYIAYSVDVLQQTGDLWRMNADGSGKVNLTNNPNDYYNHPNWSPDGQHIVCHTTRDGNYEIYRMKWDGSGLTNLSNNPGTDAEPEYSPDGSKVVFNSRRDGNYEIYVMNADGSGQTNLSNHPARDWFPTYSPDGSKIAFVSDRDGEFEIYLMNADGSNVQRLTNTEGTNETPRFAPRGLLVKPSSYDLVRGSAIGGSFEDTKYRDDDRFSMRPGLTLLSSEAPVQLEVMGFCERSAPLDLQFLIESSMSAPSGLMEVQLWDFIGGGWVTVYAGATTAQDSYVETPPPADSSRFITPATGIVRAKVLWRATGPVLVYPWQAKVDFLGWLARPA